MNQLSGRGPLPFQVYVLQNKRLLLTDVYPKFINVIATKSLDSFSSLLPSRILKLSNIAGTWRDTTKAKTLSMDSCIFLTGRCIHSKSVQTAVIASKTYCNGALPVFDTSKEKSFGSFERASILILECMIDISGNNSRNISKFFLAVHPVTIVLSKLEWVRFIRR